MIHRHTHTHNKESEITLRTGKSTWNHFRFSSPSPSGKKPKQVLATRSSSYGDNTNHPVLLSPKLPPGLVPAQPQALCKQRGHREGGPRSPTLGGQSSCSQPQLPLLPGTNPSPSNDQSERPCKWEATSPSCFSLSIFSSEMGSSSPTPSGYYVPEGSRSGYR